MIKNFCDKCNKELTEKNQITRAIVKKGKFKLEILLAKDDVWNDCELCIDCLKEILNNPEYIKEKSL